MFVAYFHWDFYGRSLVGGGGGGSIAEDRGHWTFKRYWKQTTKQNLKFTSSPSKNNSVTSGKGHKSIKDSRSQFCCLTTCIVD